VNFDFSDDQKMLRDQARRFLRQKSSRGVVRDVLNDPLKSYSATLWRDVAEQGWLGVAIPEEFGGLGLGHLELAVLAEEAGRALAPIPFSSTVYFFADAIIENGSPDLRRSLLPALASGDLIGAFAISEGSGPLSSSSIGVTFDGKSISGTKIPVIDGDIATHAIVLAREGGALSLAIVDLDQPSVKRETLSTLDPTRGHARIVFNKAAASRLGAAGEGWDLAQATLDRAAILVAFEQIGGAQACLDMAIDYAKSRHAFSRQIGSFQAIKHKLADMYVAVEIGRSNAHYGAWALATRSEQLPLAAAAARLAACDAYHLAVKENIQVHGGAGFTWEIDCHLFYRRAKLLAVQAGGPGVWKEKLVRRLECMNSG